MKKILNYILPVAILASVSSCSNEDPKKPGFEYMPDMYRSPSYETYTSNPNFPDSMTARQPVKGTIARGDAIYTDLDRMPYPYPETPEGYEQAGVELKNPLGKTELNMAEGKRLYQNYCIICHGEKGMGDGPVVLRNGPKPPAYNSDLLKNLPEGKMFHTTQFGKNMMGSHSSQLTASQRWKIIMYVQTLQLPDGTAAVPADSTKSTAPAKM
ncbi:MAG: cytochrome c [Bacteroidetes bacterium]|nr:cytochrome c [Bacteroidota bacterium]MBP6401625.1 cytochrome c [Bacteroidia bacterium]MBK9526466.1 cytochrome c [Bacteroidota bacterium]MBK9543958.1 cytochrome c [Bacteroidota bacterium]MBL0256570.1 cytochrome c [Bacteroidota bacterium]